MPRIFVVMGVAGSGKSTVAAALADADAGAGVGADGACYLDADDFHPAANVEKMRSGVPLTDDDRWPWLDDFADALAATAKKTTVYGACSALRRAYRDRITARAGMAVTFLHLDGPAVLIAGRMAAREGHFMPESLLKSQFATLEPIASDEDAIVVDIHGDAAAIVADIRAQINRSGGG